MPSRLTILTLLAGLLAILLSPQIGRASISQAAFIEAPPKFVRDKALEYDFVRGLQKPDTPFSLDALILTRNTHKFSAILGKRDEALEIRNVGLPRTGKLQVNGPTRFQYRENFEWGQGIVNTLKFGNAGDAATNFEVVKTWQGSLVLMALVKMGIVRAVGGGVGGLAEFKNAVEDAYDEKFRVWGGGRYE